MRTAHLGVVASLLLFIVGLSLAPTEAAGPDRRPALSPGAFTPIADIVQREISSGHIPGAVVVIGQGHEIVYRRAFGWRMNRPQAEPMTVDTVFDLASLTKVVATTTAVMQLVERGRLDLDAPASTYWPAFGTEGKEAITIRDLLTHYSGLRPDLSMSRPWSGYDTAMNLLAAEHPLHPTRTQYVYSDENFEVLGEIVRRISGKPLDRYCEDNIFTPLRMLDTHFQPDHDQAGRIAPTSAAGVLRDGRVVVNDPTAQRMGGVAGHAGLFSTADDLAIFAGMLLDGGTSRKVQVLRPDSIGRMTRPESPAAGSRIRGLGWDLAAPFAASAEARPATSSFGHTGFTGTMIWIDPSSQSYVIVLTNRTYPNGRGDAQPLRKAILARVQAASAVPLKNASIRPD
jgi:CubicO group peptidase (beta-lactamase class C family)